jgi:hypothetical protein
LLEALFSNVKFPVLRKLEREELERVRADFEKRLSSGYAKRMLADETYSVVAPTLEKAFQAFTTWRNAFNPAPLDEADAAALCEELVTTAHRIEHPSRQARLLAQAALLSMKELLDEYGLAPKPKRRGSREIDPDTHPLLEQDPPDPNAPTPEEQAELDADLAEAEPARAAKASVAIGGEEDRTAEAPRRPTPSGGKRRAG